MNQDLLERSLPLRTGKSRKMIKTKKPKPQSPDLFLLHVSWYLTNMADGFGMSPADARDMTCLAQRWRDAAVAAGCLIEGVPQPEPIAKWFYASMFSYITHQELPPLGGLDVPARSQLLKKLWGTGGPGRFVRGFLFRMRSMLSDQSRASRKGRLEALSVASTIANFKKGSPVPSETAVEQARLKHEKCLSDRTSVQDKREHLDTPISDSTIVDEIRSIVRTVYGGARFSGASTPFPSIAGHYESSRGHSGAAGYIKKFCPTRIGTELVSMHTHPAWSPYSYGGYWDVRGEPTSDLEEALLKVTPGFGKSEYLCKPSFILEPCKVRPVTAGPALEYYLCMPLQKYLWRTLKNHPTFRLIAEPVTAAALNEQLLANAAEGCAWLSGDYSAATDNLRQLFSRTAFDEICRVAGVPAWLRRMGSKSLVGHTIEYTDKVRGEDGKVKKVKKAVRQWNGQLMGSPLSFPILCLVNAAICSLAYKTEWEHENTPLREQPLLVNGDDCVMAFNERQKRAWEQISAHAGLSPSIGKCYYSRRFLQINSENFILEDGKFVSVPYINFSLCNATKAKGGEERHWSDLGATARQFVAGHDDSVKPRLMSAFIRRQKIRGHPKIPHGMSWWLPECLGGLGLPWHPEPGSTKTLESETSPQQRKLATYLRGRIEAGEKPLRRFQSAWVPKWVKEGMRRASSWEVRVKDEVEGVISDEKGKIVQQKAIGDYSPWMWQSLYESTEQDTKLEPAEDLCAAGPFWAVWKTAQENCHFIRPVQELVDYVPPKYQMPGGLSDFFARVLDHVPRKILSGVSALRLRGTLEPAATRPELDLPDLEGPVWDWELAGPYSGSGVV